MPKDDMYWHSLPSESDTSSPQPYQSKNYVDPWDLENYAYIRKHLNSVDISSEEPSSGEFIEANSTSFDYMPANQNQEINTISRYDSLMTDHGTYAAIDEMPSLEETYQHQGAAVFGRYQDVSYDDSSLMRKNSKVQKDVGVNDFDEPVELDNSLLYVYETKDKFRLPNFPVSPSNQYGIGYDSYLSRQDLYCKLEDMKHYERNLSPIYDDIPQPNKPNFGLSNYGHLKIDYSYSWNNLNKYIPS